MPFQTIDFKKFQAPQKRSRRWRNIAALVALAIALLAIAFYVFGSRSADKSSASTTVTPDIRKQAAKENISSASQHYADDGFNMKKYSLDDPSSIWVIVNKRRPLQPKDYAPKVTTPNVPLRQDADNEMMKVSTAATPSLEAMFAAAKKAGVDLMLASGYRSYDDQVTTYDSEVNGFGQDYADRESARPGYSEHQTGLAVDIEPANRQCEIEDCFGDTPEGKWVTQHAHEYGFVLRYTESGEPVTGYRHETWHFRYVGKDLAQEIHKHGDVPLETFFGLGNAPDYQ